MAAASAAAAAPADCASQPIREKDVCMSVNQRSCRSFGAKACPPGLRVRSAEWPGPRLTELTLVGPVTRLSRAQPAKAVINVGAAEAVLLVTLSACAAASGASSINKALFVWLPVEEEAVWAPQKKALLRKI